jgi:hypothetical protein
MTDLAKCPYCGEDSDGFRGLMCCTYFTDLGDGVVLKRSDRCYENEIAAKDAEIDRLRTAITEASRLCEQACDNTNKACDIADARQDNTND